MTRKAWGIPEYEGPRSRRIRKLVAVNPKRGCAALRFAKYRDGMTVADYVQDCEGLCGSRNYALVDITWDTDPKRHFIELYD